jgi:phosphomannomutase
MTPHDAADRHMHLTEAECLRLCTFERQPLCTYKSVRCCAALMASMYTATRCSHTLKRALQAKLTVADRHVVRCTADETRAVSPPGLQARLLRASAAAAAAAGGACRCFVRPSGTEDAVRVYAEAPSQAAADALALTALQVCSVLCSVV